MKKLLIGHCNETKSFEYAAKRSLLLHENYSLCNQLTLSSIGCGTYLGGTEATTQNLIIRSIAELLIFGVNVIDTAPNYRSGLSERAVGQALHLAIASGIHRESIFISSKLGILSDHEQDFLKRSEIIDNRFCFSSKYLEATLNESRNRLGVSTIDCLFLHNIDEVADYLSANEYEHLLQEISATLRVFIDKELIHFIGLATWNGFRAPNPFSSFMGLLKWTQYFDREGLGKYFRFIQIPFGVWAPEAMIGTTQTNPVLEVASTTLSIANDIGLGVFANSALLQGELLTLPRPRYHSRHPLSLAQAYIQWSRSQPEIAVTLVGMKSRLSVMEGQELMQIPKPAGVTFFVD